MRSYGQLIRDITEEVMSQYVAGKPFSVPGDREKLDQLMQCKQLGVRAWPLLRFESPARWPCLGSAAGPSSASFHAALPSRGRVRSTHRTIPRRSMAPDSSHKNIRRSLTQTMRDY